MEDYINPAFGWSVAAVAWFILVFLILGLHRRLSVLNKKHPTPPQVKKMSREEYEDMEIRKALERPEPTPLFDYDKEVQDSK